MQTSGFIEFANAVTGYVNLVAIADISTIEGGGASDVNGKLTLITLRDGRIFRSHDSEKTLSARIKLHSEAEAPDDPA